MRDLSTERRLRHEVLRRAGQMRHYDLNTIAGIAAALDAVAQEGD